MTAGLKRWAGALLAGALVLSGCTGGDDVEPKERLSQAKQLLDEAKSVHVTVDRAQGKSMGIVSVDGVLARPASFEGTVKLGGAFGTVAIDVVSVDSKVWIRALGNSFREIDPAQYGVEDPASLFDPKTGMSALLTEGSDVKRLKRTRFGDEVLDQIQMTLKADQVPKGIPGVGETDVELLLGIAEKSGQLRKLDIMGIPDGDISVILDRYGEPVTISPPTS